MCLRPAATLDRWHRRLTEAKWQHLRIIRTEAKNLSRKRTELENPGQLGEAGTDHREAGVFKQEHLQKLTFICTKVCLTFDTK